MSDAPVTVTKSTFPIFGILGIILVTLKVLGIGLVAEWSWWLVLLPFYGPALLALAILAIVGIVFLIAAIFGR